MAFLPPINLVQPVEDLADSTWINLEPEKDEISLIKELENRMSSQVTNVQ